MKSQTCNTGAYNRIQPDEKKKKKKPDLSKIKNQRRTEKINEIKKIPSVIKI